MKNNNVKSFLRFRAALDIENQEYREDLSNNLIALLTRKGVISRSGEVAFDRKGCEEYLLTILPLLDDSELELINSNPEQFYERFCFSPKGKEESLFNMMGRPLLDGRHFGRMVWDIFEEYRILTNLSPYEKNWRSEIRNYASFHEIRLQILD